VLAEIVVRLDGGEGIGISELGEGEDSLLRICVSEDVAGKLRLELFQDDERYQVRPNGSLRLMLLQTSLGNVQVSQ